MKPKQKQYTLRGIPARVDTVLREKAEAYGVSLNEAALKALAQGLGLGEGIVLHDNLDDLAGTWVQDESFDRAMESMDRIDEGLWR